MDKPLVTYRALPTTPAQFVEFWRGQYQFPEEDLYLSNIGKPLSPERVRALYIWKNGNELSALKMRSVEQNYISRIEEVRQLPNDLGAERFLERFSEGGPIWRIFWLHCWQPDRFPIYDQHVHRARCEIQDGRPAEPPTGDRDKVNVYLNRYIPFYRRFDGINPSDADRALWCYGRFVKQWRFR